MSSDFFMRRKIAFVFFIVLISITAAFAQGGRWNVVQKNAPGDLVTVFFTSSSDGWIGGDDGYLAFTKDGGVTWQRHPLKISENINEIYFRGDDNGYILAGQKIYITRDKGVTWRDAKVIDLNELKGLVPEFLSIRFVNKRRGYIVGSVSNREDVVVDSLVLQTTDGGETWQRIKVPTKNELFHLDFVGEKRGWIVGDKGVIIATRDGGVTCFQNQTSRGFKVSIATRDGGVTWQMQFSGTDRALRSVDFRDEDEGYIVGNRGTILRTQNGGGRWEIVKTPYTDTFYRVVFPDDKNGYIVGRSGLILRTENKGSTWLQQESGTEEPLYGLYMERRFGWSVGGGGVVLRYQR